MGLAVAVDEFYSVFEALKLAGYDATQIVNQPWDELLALLRNSGYSPITTASGATVFTKVYSAGAVSTATSTAGYNASSLALTYLNPVDDVVNVSLAGLGNAKASAVALTAPEAIIVGAAGALGLIFGFDLGQYLYSEFFGSGDFDWSTDSVGGKILTYVSEDGKTYVNQDLLNRVKDRLIEIGVFSEVYNIPQKADVIGRVPVLSWKSLVGPWLNTAQSRGKEYVADYLLNLSQAELGGINLLSITTSSNSSYTNYQYVIYSFAPNDLVSFSPSAESSPDRYNGLLYTLNPSGFSYALTFDSVTNWNRVQGHLRYQHSADRLDVITNPTYSSGSDIKLREFSGAVTLYGIGSMTSGVPGVSKQSGAVYPNSDSIGITYPNWYQGGFEISAPTADNIDNKIYVTPVTIPDINTGTIAQPDAQTGDVTENELDRLINSQLDIVIDSSISVPSVSTENIGNSPSNPPLPPDSGITQSGMVALYSPSKAQLREFSAWLWSNNFIDNLKKMFTDPMSAIIGLHILYARPTISSTSEIQVGYLNSGVESGVVANQYIDLDCGYINVLNYFNNILDYNQYTKLQLYLPFIGIVDLNVNDVMTSKLSVSYRVDVLTGACLANISVERNGVSGVLYSFAGNCAVQLPLSGGDYSSIISNCIGAVASVGALALSKGSGGGVGKIVKSLAPSIISGLSSVASGSDLNVSRSGSLGSNAGALGIKIPYLIITRPVPYEATNYNYYYGVPSNTTCKLADNSGFTKVKSVHIDKISATDEEISMIESLLLEGVII